MKKLLLFMLPALVALSSCDNYGKKLAVGESEIFYKEGVTETEAKALGEFLVKNELFAANEKRSAQITKDGDKYIVNLVIDQKKLDSSVRLNLWKLQSNLSGDVFNGADVRFALADDTFQNGDVLEATDLVKLGKASVYFESKNYKKEDVSELAAFLQAKGLFQADKEADVFLSSEGEKPVIRIIVDKAYMEENLDLVLPAFGYWQYLVQNELPQFKNAAIRLTSTQYEDYKTVPQLSAEEVAQFENAGAEAASTQQTNYSNSSAAETSAVPTTQEQE